MTNFQLFWCHYSKRSNSRDTRRHSDANGNVIASSDGAPTTAVAIVTPASRADNRQRVQSVPPTQTFQAVAPRLRNAVLARGFFRTLSTWPMTVQFRSLSSDDRVASIEYLRWCRDLFLVFARYGSSRSCTMIESAEILDTMRDGAWHQGRLFEVWSKFQRQLSTDIHFEHQGWLQPVPQQPHQQHAADIDMDEGQGGRSAVEAFEAELSEDVESGRPERIRLLSLDGHTDPRNDRTAMDDDYAALHDLSGFSTSFLPNGDDIGHQTIEEELTTQQQALRELNGTMPFPSGLSDLP